MKESESFNAPSIVRNDETRKDRLRYWNDDLCHRRPHTFDIVIAVSDLPAPCNPSTLTESESLVVTEQSSTRHPCSRESYPLFYPFLWAPLASSPNLTTTITKTPLLAPLTRVSQFPCASASKARLCAQTGDRGTRKKPTKSEI